MNPNNEISQAEIDAFLAEWPQLAPLTAADLTRCPVCDEIELTEEMTAESNPLTGLEYLPYCTYCMGNPHAKGEPTPVL